MEKDKITQVLQAIDMAMTFHKGQFDKDGQPYILHPLAVMSMMNTEEEKIVAILHDTIEDTKLVFADLYVFDSPIIDALRCLTRQDQESYQDYIFRVKENKLATKVKIADLEHNMDIRRLDYLIKDDLKRLTKYHKAWRFLTND